MKKHQRPLIIGAENANCARCASVSDNERRRKVENSMVLTRLKDAKGKAQRQGKGVEDGLKEKVMERK